MSRKLPFKIATAPNPAMGGFDLHLQVGGFKDKSEAEDFAKVLVQFMEDNCNAWSARVQ